MNIIKYISRTILILLVGSSAGFIENGLYGQGLTSSIGDRENIGIYGGPANDLTFCYTNQRLFAGVTGPATLMFSNDNSQSWLPAFPFDSLEYHLGMRGWGGGIQRVLANQKGWVLAQTGSPGFQFSASVISYDGGNIFRTAFDPFLLKKLTSEIRPVTAIALTDHFAFTGLSEYLVRLNDTSTFGMDQILLKIDTLPGYVPGSSIRYIAAANDVSGFPIYFVVSNPLGNNLIYKYYGGLLFELLPPTPNNRILNIFTHPGQITGDTIFISSFNQTTQAYQLHKSYFGGFNWLPVTVPGINRVLSDADYSPNWVPQMPISKGLRLSFPGGLISDNLGATWQGPALDDYGIATHPVLLNQVLGSNHIGVVLSMNGISGPFNNTTNMGFTGLKVRQFDQSPGLFYIATSAGLAYSEQYYNPLIIGYNKWIPPNGLFPVPNAGNTGGVSAVAIDPNNPLHVICGSSDGFYISFSGPNGFFDVVPTNWNMNGHLDPFVTDIQFLASNIIIATTGLKHETVDQIPQLPVGNIWRSDNGGISWYIITPLFPDEYVMGNCLVLGNNLNQPVLYSGTGYDDGQGYVVPGALWRSFNYGITWTKYSSPVFGGSPIPLPVYDVDVFPQKNDTLYVSSKMVLARSENGGQNYFITDIPYNTGDITSALIDPLFPDSLAVTAGRNIYKYNYTIDDADLKFRGFPGERFTCSEFGSVLGGSDIGASKIKEAPTYLLHIKAFMEGPFNQSSLTMNTGLNSNGQLPLLQPFNQQPWNYDGTEHVAAIPNPDIVDWVLIELRKTTGDPSTATKLTQFNRQAAFLLKDGTIVDDDGVGDLRFSIILDNNKGNDKVHGVVLSPSHTGERTANEMTAAKTTAFSYDFTTGPDQVYGGAAAHKELAPGVWGMISGDGNNNGQVENRDKNEVWLIENGLTGYYFGDFNRDGTVDIIDLVDYWKPNSGRGNIID